MAFYEELLAATEAERNEFLGIAALQRGATGNISRPARSSAWPTEINQPVPIRPASPAALSRCRTPVL